MSTWRNIQDAAPPIGQNVRAKDSVAGPEYIARFNGHGAWMIIQFPHDYQPKERPTYWLDNR